MSNDPQSIISDGDGPDHSPGAAPPGDGDDVVQDELVGLARDREEDTLRELVATNFIEYASYVIKERAIPHLNDGLKPVQRRILHSLFDMDDGRFHKVANVIGHTMRYHPHGDASIGSALVVLANKEYFIEKQGNFGNIHTGDPASAARYIECRLTPLAREVLFNPEITEFVDSYDGRNKEPVTLPAKVPALLMLGADGIAVGMTTRILPHNFAELLEAQIAILEDREFSVYPDFLTGGIMDVAEYNDGKGRVQVRAKIDAVNEKTLVVREITPTLTTEALMGSIEDAAKKGQIKVASINDYTAENVEIEILLPRGVYAKDTLPQLYAYTQCEVSISSNILVIEQNRPVTRTVTEVLKHATEKLVEDLRREQEIELGKLRDRFHEKTLAQIFIENRIYKRIEECETWAEVTDEVQEGFVPFVDRLEREITTEDIEKLLQIQIRRISRFDINKNQAEIDKIVLGIQETERNLRHIRRFTTDYVKALLDKYGDRYPRQTKIADLEDVDVREVALRNIKVGHDRVNHFVGTEIRNSNKNEEPLLCTEFDRIVLMRNDGGFKVVPIADKFYVGPVKYVLRADREQVYSMIYRTRSKRPTYFAKRFRIDRYIMDRDYNIIPDGCIIESLYTNYGMVVRCELKSSKRASEQQVDIDFNDIQIRSTGARGFKITNRPVIGLTVVKRGTPSPRDHEQDKPSDDTREVETDGSCEPEEEGDEGVDGSAAATDAWEDTTLPVSEEAEKAPRSPAGPHATDGDDEPLSPQRESERNITGTGQKGSTAVASDSAEPPAEPRKLTGKRARTASTAPKPSQKASQPNAEQVAEETSVDAGPRNRHRGKPNRSVKQPRSSAKDPVRPDDAGNGGQQAADGTSIESPRANSHRDTLEGEEVGETSPPSKGTPAKAATRRLIDEETPFFLE